MKVSARLSHANRSMLAHSHAVAQAVAFKAPAVAYRCCREVAAWYRTPAPLARLGDPMAFVSRPERLRA